MKTYVLPAGSYWIGDPMNALHELDEWINFMYSTAEDIIYGPQPVTINNFKGRQGIVFEVDTEEFIPRRGFRIVSGYVGVIPNTGNDVPVDMKQFNSDDDFTVLLRDYTLYVGDISITLESRPHLEQ